MVATLLEKAVRSVIPCQWDTMDAATPPPLSSSPMDMAPPSTSAAPKRFTKKSTEWGVRVFKDWLKVQSINTNFETLKKAELDKLLARLYVEARTKEGKDYSKSAFTCLRAAIQRHLENPPWNVTYVIMSDPEFAHSNQVLQGVFKQLTEKGLDISTHYCPIERGDFIKLATTGTIGISQPRALQNLVWLSVALHFGKRGQEGYRGMTKDTFLRAVDDAGQVYIAYAAAEKQKKHKGNSAASTYKPQARMYARPGDPMCPVEAYDLYLSRLDPDLNCLWQKPRSNVMMSDPCWYVKQPLGHNTLERMMKRMCEKAQLTTIHTNHCTRATTIKILGDAGFDRSDIVKVTGHRDTRSLDTYIGDATSSKKQKLSQTIGSSLCIGQPSGIIENKENELIKVSANTKSTSDDDDDDDDADDLFMDIKIEEEDPLDAPSTSDVPTSYNENFLPKKPRLDNTVSDQVGLTEEVFIKNEDIKIEEEEVLTTDNRPLEGSGQAETNTGPKPQKSHTLRNSTTTTTTNSTTNTNESLKDVRFGSRDIYDVFGAHIAKTLRDINDESTFTQVKMKINDILLEALAGHFITPENPQTKILLPVNTSPQFMILPGNSQNNSQMIVIPNNSVLPANNSVLPNNSILPSNNSVLPNNSILPPNNSVLPNNSQTPKRHRVTRIFPNNSQSHMLPAGRGSSVLYLPMDPGQVPQNQTSEPAAVSDNNT